MTDFSPEFLSGANVAYLAELYASYLKNAGAVDPSWAAFFADLHDDPQSLWRDIHGASWTPETQLEKTSEKTDVKGKPAKSSGAANAFSEATESNILDSIRALMMIRIYRVRGHLEAQLDPLGLEQRGQHAELDPATYGFTETDYDRPIFLGGMLGLDRAPLSEILGTLRRTYCGAIGVEFMHIQDSEQKDWIQNRIEGAHRGYGREGKLSILERLTAAEGFEKFCQMKYTGTKRFGLEGGEALIAALNQVLVTSAQLGVREAIFGMAHRGRLNVLTNTLGKSFTAIFSEFQGNSANPADVQGSGDVKYHLGTSSDQEFGGKMMHVSLAPNPSHLEAVNPVVLGKVRAKQDQSDDRARAQVMGLLIHGDAAMAGQGLVAESLALSELKGYRTGGTMNIVINNQIGFTTAPQYSRSGPYSTDVAKMIQAPIFHVNGDDPEAVCEVSRIAAEFRHEFKKDVVIDIVCYRRQGHNEGDEPAFTQPIMYRAIKDHPTTRTLYAEKLIGEGVLTGGEAQAMAQRFQEKLEGDFQAANSYKPNKADWLEGRWTGFAPATGQAPADTAVTPELLQKVGRALVTTPAGFEVNAKIVRQLKAKEEMLASGDGVDWATAEALAFGTLLCEGSPVRLSGQDCGRGTFSQRHAVLYDQHNEERYVSLNHIEDVKTPFEVLDSPLSEAAVLGFEYGYSTSEPQALVLWEGQFGDFVNGAQVIIDQFISSAESKWLRMSGLVMLLPHGYEGQGPEHSSARFERFLQLSGEDNWQVANCTTPANYFHILRRQQHRNFRKPLILMTPKSLLRHKLCVSKIAAFTSGSTFHPVLPEVDAVQESAVKRVVLCTGKVYYDLYEERQKRGGKDVALLRLEQLYPFPAEVLAWELGKYPNAEVVWLQEEPENMGAWHFVDRRIERVLGGMNVAAKRPRYVGRIEAASPATGLMKRHLAEQAKLIDEALTV